MTQFWRLFCCPNAQTSCGRRRSLCVTCRRSATWLATTSPHE